MTTKVEYLGRYPIHSKGKSYVFVLVNGERICYEDEWHYQHETGEFASSSSIKTAQGQASRWASNH